MFFKYCRYCYLRINSLDGTGLFIYALEESCVIRAYELNLNWNQWVRLGDVISLNVVDSNGFTSFIGNSLSKPVIGADVCTAPPNDDN